MHATRAPGPPDAPSSHPRFEVRRADGSLRRRRVIRPKPATLKVDKRAPPGVECYKLTAPDEGMKGTLTRVPESEGVHPHGPPPRLASRALEHATREPTWQVRTSATVRSVQGGGGAHTRTAPLGAGKRGGRSTEPGVKWCRLLAPRGMGAHK